jgi:hypothetical protein
MSPHFHSAHQPCSRQLDVSTVGHFRRLTTIEVRFRTLSGSLSCTCDGRKRANTGHRGSNPLAVKACLTAGDVRYAISALAASTCLLPALIPATYKE